MSTPGERIREMRMRNHLTLDDVAKRLNVNRQAVYKYEHGVVTNIPLDNLEKMAEMFGTTPGYLAGWIEENPSVNNQTPDDDPQIRIVSGMMENLSEEQKNHIVAIVRAVVETQKGDQR